MRLPRNRRTHAGPAGGEHPRSFRNRRIDALKFLAIAMVVLQHVLNLRWEFKGLAPWLVEAMMAFNMPLFIFMSGYVLLGREGRSPVHFLRGKALAILVPYFAWILVGLPLRGIPVTDWPARLARAAIDPSAGLQMWFLYVLFISFLVFAVVRALSRGSHMALAASGIVVAVLPLLPIAHTNLANRLAWLYPFLIAGYLVAARRRRLQGWDILIAIAGLIAFPVLFAAGIDGVLDRFAIGLAGIAGSWGVMRLQPDRVIAPLAWGGERTLGMYGGQMVLMPFLVTGSGWLGAIATWLLVVFGALGLTVLLERTAVTRALFLGRWLRRRSSGLVTSRETPA